MLKNLVENEEEEDDHTYDTCSSLDRSEYGSFDEDNVSDSKLLY